MSRNGKRNHLSFNRVVYRVVISYVVVVIKYTEYRIAFIVVHHNKASCDG